MVKKLIVFVTAFIMLLSLMACYAEGLAEHKEAAKSSLDVYVATKIESDYAPEYWTAMLKLVSDGKIAIDEAKNKVGVDKAVKTAKTGVDEALMEARMKHNAVMYSQAKVWMKEEFLNNNLTRGVVFDDGPLGEQYPKDRVLIVRNQGEFDEIFIDFPPRIDFEEELLLIYIFTDMYPSRKYEIKNVALDNQSLQVVCKLETYPISIPDASAPFQRCLVVKMDKILISTAKFKII